MTIEGAIPSILLDDEEVTALVGDRVRPIALVAKDKKPFVAMSITGAEDPSPTFKGTSGFTRTTFDLIVYARTYSECATVSGEIRRVLDGYGGTVEDVKIVPCRFDDQSDIEETREEGSELPVFVRSQTYRALHKAV